MLPLQTPSSLIQNLQKQASVYVMERSLGIGNLFKNPVEATYVVCWKFTSFAMILKYFLMSVKR